MIQEVINPYKDALAELEYITKLGGAVTTISKKVKDTIQKFPAVYNGDPSTCSPDDYIDFVPNTKELGMIYFEEKGSVAKEQNKHYVLMESSIRLVGFFNLKALDQQNTIIIAANVLNRMPRLPQSQPLAKAIKWNFVGEAKKSERIFSEYTYKEEDKQPFIYPYGYFALDFAVQWRLSWSCIDELQIPETPICP